MAMTCCFGKERSRPRPAGWWTWCVGLLIGVLIAEEAVRAATPLPDASAQAPWTQLGDRLPASAPPVDGAVSSAYLRRVGIIGQDRRRKLNQQELRQHSGLVAIYSKAADSEGTGFLVCDGSVVLTSAHVFFDESGNLKGPLSQFELYLRGSLGSFQRVYLDDRPGSYRVGRTTDFRRHPHEDWMLLRLNTRPNPRLFQPYKLSSENEVLNLKNEPHSDVRVIGYLNNGSWEALGATCSNFRSTKSTWQYSSGSENFYYSHDCTTEGGASGSPVILNSCQGNPRVIAIHSGGHSDFRAQFDHERPWRNNYAIPISHQILEAVRQMCGNFYSQAVC